MTVFKTYSIFIVLIFILSFEKLNAPPKNENEISEALNKIRLKCYEDIDFIFEDNDLLKNAKIAFEYIIRVNENSCFLILYQQEASSNVCAYYKEFNNHLLSDDVPDAQSFCDAYKENILNPDDCVDILNQNYGSIKHDALKKMFNEHGFKVLPEGLLLMVNRTNYIDIAHEYFYEVKETFKLNTEQGGMPPPKEFCDKLHSYD